MSQFKLIGAKDALSMIENEQAKLVDIRDPQAFAKSHAPGAIHLTNDTVVNFMNETEFDETVLVMCYHGVSSQSAAEYLANQGYEDVYSVEGGFAAWERANYPVEA